MGIVFAFLGCELWISKRKLKFASLKDERAYLKIHLHCGKDSSPFIVRERERERERGMLGSSHATQSCRSMKRLVPMCGIQGARHNPRFTFFFLCAFLIPFSSFLLSCNPFLLHKTMEWSLPHLVFIEGRSSFFTQGEKLHRSVKSY